jgi:mono/diheme cytochrome c family protein
MAVFNRLAACFLIGSLFVFALGCSSGSPSGESGPAPNPIDPNATAASGSGNATFDQKCAKCHSLTGPGGGPKRSGPDLSKVGAAPDHNAAWIADHIKNPQSHKPGSKMPAFEAQLKPEEIKEIADWLATKK